MNALSSRLVLAVTVVALASLLLLAPDALAATGNDVGGNLDGLLKQYAGEIYGGILAIVALVFLVNRRYTELGMPARRGGGGVAGVLP